MFKSFRSKLTGSYLLVIFSLLLIAGVIIYPVFKNYYLERLEQRLTREAYLVADTIKYSQPQTEAEYNRLCAAAARDSEMRVSIIDQSGKVLGESDYDSSLMESHKSRPEVYQALHGNVGVSLRYSQTLQVNMLYVAAPYTYQGQSGAVRLAMPLSELSAINRTILMIMLLALLISATLSVLLSLFMARKISGPLDEITAAARDISGGNLKRRINNRSDDEIGYLAQAFNDMSENIERGIVELNEIKNRFQVLLENTVNGIIMVDPRGIISYANPAALKLLHFQGDMTGRKKIEAMDNYELLDAISRVQAELKPVAREIMLHHQAGDKTIEANVVPITDNDGANQGILLVLNDITELKKLDQIRKDFVANVSHELKTPLASISGFAETLMDENGANPATANEFSRIIYNEAQRMTTMINSLLELSRLEADKNEVELQPTDIDAVLRSALNLMRQQWPPTLKLEYVPAAADQIIESNDDLIVQVVCNLLDNAAKYSPEGGTVVLQWGDANGMIKIDVTDQGIGITEPEQQRIFERFYRVDKTRSRKTGGSGLGLAISKHLLEKLGGRISVASKPGEGSTFSVWLPKDKHIK
ncbi:MAG TPA: ATP-binding protein [Syntrophomonas sp.]|nr:ATP-binding protein [Syntrophomonas sp.]